jgi:hypothetical protein
MKMTLLDIVQDIENDIDGDEVSSINETTESQQIAQIVKSTYYAMMSNRNWPHLKRPVQVDASGDPALPTHMSLQQEITELVFLNYNKVKDGETRKRYEPIGWLEPDDFLVKLNRLNNDEDNVDIIIDPSGVELAIMNDRAPTHYTSFDDDMLVFNSYDSLVDTTLQSSKVQAHAYVAPQWSMQDDFIPDLPDEAFTALLEEAKSRASLKLNQQEDVKAEGESRRQQRWLSRKAWRAHGGIRYPNYGRNSRKMKNPAIDKYNTTPTGDV